MGAKVLAGSSAAEPGEPGAEAAADVDADVAVGVAAGDGCAAEGKAGKGKRGRGGAAAAATAGCGREIVPHFPHMGRVARYCEVPVSGVVGGSRRFLKVLKGSRRFSKVLSLGAASVGSVSVWGEVELGLGLGLGREARERGILLSRVSRRTSCHAGERVNKSIVCLTVNTRIYFSISPYSFSTKYLCLIEICYFSFSSFPASIGPLPPFLDAYTSTATSRHPRPHLSPNHDVVVRLFYSWKQGRPLPGVDDANGNAAPGEVTKQNMDGSESLQRWIASDFGGSWVRLRAALPHKTSIFVFGSILAFCGLLKKAEKGKSVEGRWLRLVEKARFSVRPLAVSAGKCGGQD